MRLPLGALWPLGQTRCRLRGSSLLRTRLQVDGTAILRRVATEARSATVTQSLVCSVPVQCACHCREDLLRPCAGGHAHCSRSVCPAMSLMPPMVNLPPVLPMPPRLRPWCQCSPCPAALNTHASGCTNRCKFDKHSLSAVDLCVYGPGLQAAFTGAPTNGFSSVWPALCAPAGRVCRHALFPHPL